jgi:hypothetical protein
MTFKYIPTVLVAAVMDVLVIVIVVVEGEAVIVAIVAAP